MLFSQKSIYVVTAAASRCRQTLRDDVPLLQVTLGGSRELGTFPGFKDAAVISGGCCILSFAVGVHSLFHLASIDL